MPNICGCLVTSPPYVTTCKGNNCIYTPDLLIKSSESVTPCGDVGIILLSDKVKTPLCTSEGITPLYEIVYTTTNVATTTINSSQITFSLQGGKLDIAEIHYKVTCGMYSNIGEIMIVPKSECTGVSIPQGQQCDPCTGALSDIPVDISIGDENDGSIIDIQIT